MNKSEYSLLAQLSSLLTNQETELAKSKKYQRIFIAIGGVLVLSAFYLVSYEIISGEVAVIFAVLGGMAIATAGYFRIISGILPTLLSHLDRQSINERLEKIKHNK